MMSESLCVISIKTIKKSNKNHKEFPDLPSGMQSAGSSMHY